MNLDYWKYLEVSPHPSLKGIVDHYRIIKSIYSKPFVLPNYSPIFQGLIFNIHQHDSVIFSKKEAVELSHKVYYVGQAISPSRIASSSFYIDIIGVNFTPTAIFQLTGMDLHDITDQIVDAQLIFGTQINELYDRVVASNDPVEAICLIDDFLCRKSLNRKKQNKPCIMTSLSVLERNTAGINVEMLQKMTNTTAKTLERSFKSEIGMTPKMYHRLLRFNQTVHYISTHHFKDWWEIVVRFGYYDHSHLISEFKRFAGKTPIEYLQLAVK